MPAAILAVKHGHSYMRNCEFAKAVKWYSLAVSKDGCNWSYVANRALAKEKAGNVKGGKCDYDTAIKLHPGVGSLYEGRALCNAKLGLFQAAMDDYDRSIEIWPSASKFRGRAVLKRSLEDLDGALADYERAAEIDPPCAEDSAACGILCALKGDHAKALASYSHSLVHQPADAVVLGNRAVSRQAMRDLTRAELDYTRAIDLDPNFTKAYEGRAGLRMAQGDIDGTLSDLGVVLALSQHCKRSCARLHLKIADLKVQAGRFAEALSDLQDCESLDFFHAEASFLRGKISWQQDNIHAALAQVDRAISLKPELVMAHVFRAKLRLTSGSLDVAVQAQLELPSGLLDLAAEGCAQALQLQPDNASALNLQGEICREQGDLAGADEHFERAIALDERFADAHYNLARTKDMLGLSQEALLAYTEALFIDPSSPKAADAYRRKAALRFPCSPSQDSMLEIVDHGAVPFHTPHEFAPNDPVPDAVLDFLDAFAHPQPCFTQTVTPQVSDQMPSEKTTQGTFTEIMASSTVFPWQMHSSEDGDLPQGFWQLQDLLPTGKKLFWI